MEEKNEYRPWKQTYTSEFLSLKCARLNNGTTK